MLLERMEGSRRGRGRPHCTWIDNIQKYLSIDIMNLRLDARYSPGWRIATMDVVRVGFDSMAQGNKVMHIYIYILDVYMIFRFVSSEYLN